MMPRRSTLVSTPCRCRASSVIWPTSSRMRRAWVTTRAPAGGGVMGRGAGVRHDRIAGRREGHGARGALDQLHAEAFLQLSQLAPERRLRDMTALRRMAKVPQVRDRDQIAQFRQGHGHPLIATPYRLNHIFRLDK